jgi:16S rRNA (cytosine1402-N4)-methyltransferase
VREQDSPFHRPVMVEAVLDHMEPARDGEIMDCTVGGGGHSLALLERYPGCRIIAVDRDPTALEAARMALKDYSDRVRFVEARYDDAARALGPAGSRISGALLDMGVSTHQLDSTERGFTFRSEAPLDMRMAGAAGHEPTAADLLNTMSEDELGRVFREYGEEPQWRRLAKAVSLLRGDRPFRVAADLVEAMGKAYRRPPRTKEKARVFQALRIEVNREIEALDAALPALRDALLPDGVMTVISYESLADRTVKRAFAEWSRDCVCPPGLPTCVCVGVALGALVNRKVLRPDETEVSENPRARSARLRSWRKAA